MRMDLNRRTVGFNDGIWIIVFHFEGFILRLRCQNLPSTCDCDWSFSCRRCDIQFKILILGNAYEFTTDKPKHIELLHNWAFQNEFGLVVDRSNPSIGPFLIDIGLPLVGPNSAGFFWLGPTQLSNIWFSFYLS